MYLWKAIKHCEKRVKKPTVYNFKHFSGVVLTLTSLSCVLTIVTGKALENIVGRREFVCLGFYAISKVFQLSNGDNSQIHVSWTIFNQYLTSSLSWHWQAGGSAIPIILSAKGESHYSTTNISVGSVADLSRRSLVRYPARPIFFPRVDDSHCHRIHSSLTSVQCFEDGYVWKQPVAWTEYFAQYWLK